MTLHWHQQPSKCKAIVGPLALWLCIATLISGCSGTPVSLNYYLLHPTGLSVERTTPPIMVTVDKIHLPDYLKHRGLVYQTSDTNIHISTSHLWAEPVEEGMLKTLKQSLLKEGVRLVRADQYEGENPIHLSLYINDFVSTYSGVVILTGEYTLVSSPGVPHVVPFSFRTPLAHDGFSASVSAMREALDSLASTVAKAITKDVGADN